MDLTLHFTLTSHDLDEFVSYHKRALPNFPSHLSFPKKPRFLYSGAAYILVLAIALLLFIIFHKDPSAPAHPVAPTRPASSLLLGLVLDIIPYLVILLIIWFVFLRNHFRSPGKSMLRNSPDLAQPQTIHLTDDLFSVSTPTTETHIRWPHFPHFYETPNLWLLYTPSKGAHVLPKRAFPDPAALDTFRNFLRSKISLAPNAFPITPIP